MTTGEAVPDRAGFARLARGSRLVPVTRRLLADGETPVGVYRKLAGGRHLRPQAGQRVGAPARVAGGQRDGRAVPGELDHRFEADPGVGTGHHRAAAGEVGDVGSRPRHGPILLPRR